MEEAKKKQVERYQAEFEQKFNKPAWTKEDVEIMKDLKKLEYYTEALCAMKEAQDNQGYPGQEQMEQRGMGMSYANQNRNSQTGRYMSGHYPMYYDNGSSNGMSNGRGNGMSGRRYYDSEQMGSIEELRRMNQTIEQAIRNLEAR